MFIQVTTVKSQWLKCYAYQNMHSIILYLEQIWSITFSLCWGYRVIHHIKKNDNKFSITVNRTWESQLFDLFFPCYWDVCLFFGFVCPHKNKELYDSFLSNCVKHKLVPFLDKTSTHSLTFLYTKGLVQMPSKHTYITSMKVLVLWV